MLVRSKKRCPEVAGVVHFRRRIVASESSNTLPIYSLGICGLTCKWHCAGINNMHNKC